MVGLTLALGAKQRRVGRQRLIWAGGVVGAIRVGGVGIGACQGGDQILGGTDLVSGSGGRLGLLEEGHDLVLAESPWRGEGREREKAGGEIGTELIGGARVLYIVAIKARGLSTIQCESTECEHAVLQRTCREKETT